MKTFKHKVSDLLATITEKTVWMSDLQGHIYKQFPIQHLNPDQFEDATIDFPGDFEAERLAFQQRESCKRAEREAIRLKRAEEEAKRQEEIRIFNEQFNWNLRHAAQTHGTIWILEGTQRRDNPAVCDDGKDPWSSPIDGYPQVFFSKEEAVDAFNDCSGHPDYGWEEDYSLYELRGVDQDLYEECSTPDEIFDYMLCGGGDLMSEEIMSKQVTPEYKSIVGCIVVAWSWQTHVGYCRKLESVFMVEDGDREFQTEYDLITGYEDCTFRTNYEILLTKEEVESCEQLLDENGNVIATKSLNDKILDALNQSRWKWQNYKRYTEKDLDFIWG